MKKIIVSTDTGSDLPPTLAEKHNVKIVPMHVIMDNVSYADRSIPIDDLYDYYDRTNKVPSTSAVNVGEYIEFFKNIQSEYPGCVIMHLSFSSNASCTFQNAKIAAEGFEDVYIVDTHHVAGGLTAHIMKSIEIINSKGDDITDYQALADELAAIADKVHCSFMPGNLDYLKAGGRVSNAQYLGAAILRLHPLIEIIDGYLVSTKKYRGSMDKILDKYMEEFISKSNMSRDCLYVLYSKGLSEEILTRVKENSVKMGFKNCQYVQTGCVMTGHCGPGGLGFAGVEEI